MALISPLFSQLNSQPVYLKISLQQVNLGLCTLVAFFTFLILRPLQLKFFYTLHPSSFVQLLVPVLCWHVQQLLQSVLTLRASLTLPSTPPLLSFLRLLVQEVFILLQPPFSLRQVQLLDRLLSSSFELPFCLLQPAQKSSRSSQRSWQSLSATFSLCV